MKRGFGAIVGNPPWVSYAGRAAQPLDDRLRGYFTSFYEGFGGYRNLQALFVERAVTQLLAPQGRLGVILPSSMAELDGYGPSRAIHDRFAECDTELPDLGEDSFRGVSQPSMVLRSTRRVEEREDTAGETWPIARPDLDAGALRILRELEGEVLPPTLFGERGLQSSGDDVQHLLEAPGPGTVPIRVGSDIKAFHRSVPSLNAETAWFGSRLRAASEWANVKVLIRQTARVPIAVRSDGGAFRNSILAGFEDADHPADFLVGYLNSTPIRWYHFNCHRDARLGMPQVKIGHLRSIPTPRDKGVIAALADLGATWSKRNSGIDDDDQARLDKIVASGLGIRADDLARMCRDAVAWS
ncbi:MAG: hypothetical protein U0169_04305 [Polyangiaceae bacterium]